MSHISTIRLDVHAHLVPLDRTSFDGIAWTDAGTAVVDGVPVAKRELYDPELLVTWMKRNGVEEAWVSVPPGLYREQLGAEDARAWADTLNRNLVEKTAAYPCLKPMLYLPLCHAEVAADVAGQASLRGHRIFSMPAGSPRRSVNLSDPKYMTLWRRLNEAEAFLLLHPAGTCDTRLSSFSLHALLGGPSETAVAAAHLTMGGVLEKFPGITFCLTHGGGNFTSVAGRLQRGQDTGSAGAYLGGEKVRAAMKRFCVDCITHDPEVLALAASAFGTDRVLFGSDWPFEMGLIDPHQQLSETAVPLRENILVGNPHALLRRLGL